MSGVWVFKNGVMRLNDGGGSSSDQQSGGRKKVLVHLPTGEKKRQSPHGSSREEDNNMMIQSSRCHQGLSEFCFILNLSPTTPLLPSHHRGLGIQEWGHSSQRRIHWGSAIVEEEGAGAPAYRAGGLIIQLPGANAEGLGMGEVPWRYRASAVPQEEFD
ncbi:hypothetical protein ACET3Z_000160 [Daucus carota]